MEHAVLTAFADITDKKKRIRNTDKSVLINEQNQKCLHFNNPFKISLNRENQRSINHLFFKSWQYVVNSNSHSKSKTHLCHISAQLHKMCYLLAVHIKNPPKLHTLRSALKILLFHSIITTVKSQICYGIITVIFQFN